MQANLFDAEQDLQQPIRHRLGDAQLLEYPQIFQPDQATLIFADLLARISWRQEFLKIGGKVRAIPRLQCWMGDSSSSYGYSGVRMTPCPWDKKVQTIQDRVQQLSGLEFNSVLINLYRNGQDSVAWHADNETELGENSIIASVSLGAERDFQLKQKQGQSSQKFQLRLRHGSLLIMGAGMQKNWLHQLPKVKGLDAARINLTFRNILRK